MSNEYDEIDTNCRCTSKKMQEFYYWKYHRELYLDSLKNGTFDIVKDGNYAEYFAKKYVFGKYYYNLMSDFNKRVALKFKQSEYAAYISDMAHKINNTFRMDKFQFIVNPMNIQIKDFASIDITDKNTKNAESYCYKVMNDKNRPKEYDDETLGLIATFSFRILDFSYDSILRKYVNLTSLDEREQNFKISLSNFKDNVGKFYQVISLFLNARTSDMRYFDHMITFYYTPKDHPMYSSNISSCNSYPNFEYHDVDCLLNHYYNNFAIYVCDVFKNKVHLYRCEKPIFDEHQLKILRTYSFIADKSYIEAQKESTGYYSISTSDRKSKTRKYCENLLKKKYPQMNTLEIEKQMFIDYPMYVPAYFSLAKASKDINSLYTQADKQLFFSTIVKVLNNIENNIPTNSFKQDKSYLSDSFVSSRDALVPLSAKVPTHEYKMFICNDTNNYTMILNKMMFDETGIDDLH